VEDQDYLKRPLSRQQSCLLQSSIKRQRRHYDKQHSTISSKIPIIRRVPGTTPTHVLIIDTGGGVTPTITANAWKVTHTYNVTMSMLGYQSKEPPQECKVVNAITKVTIPGREEAVIFDVNYATLIMDDAEYESLVVPFEMMKHGIKVDMVPPKYMAALVESQLMVNFYHTVLTMRSYIGTYQNPHEMTWIL
jgi:hypothetical protein